MSFKEGYILLDTGYIELVYLLVVACQVIFPFTVIWIFMTFSVIFNEFPYSVPIQAPISRIMSSMINSTITSPL